MPNHLLRQYNLNLFSDLIAQSIRLTEQQRSSIKRIIKRNNSRQTDLLNYKTINCLLKLFQQNSTTNMIWMKTEHFISLPLMADNDIGKIHTKLNKFKRFAAVLELDKLKTLLVVSQLIVDHKMNHSVFSELI